MIIILGKNGAGKSYLLGRLAEKGFCRVVGYTTRPMRPKEVDGSDYFFVTKEKFEELIAQGFFVEHKKLGENYYGTPKDAINSHSVMIAGNVADLKKLTAEEIIPIFVNASIDQRYHRVLRRKSTEEEIFKRFHGESFKYLDKFHGFFIDNEKENDAALGELLSLFNADGEVLSKEKMKDNEEFLKDYIKSFKRSELSNVKDPMLLYFKYEEYLMRLLSLENFARVEDLRSAYFDNMKRFMEDFNLKFEEKDGELFVTFNKIAHNISFDNEKVGKMLGMEWWYETVYFFRYSWNCDKFGKT